ncbi:ABC transporter ATP-binding protein [Domibacillus sp. DTU_2020_1001157_1_SI_ALB_TIR_016]|uniref:ABC transporter ATP-binding protein n=1 Tax=Domibacillus sp. DTU_2020_1001157_1_SI_ALB_TIR_016 TaxID=3077789 RepID=UPI0028E1CB69|nr:ABC transporter ATP-binding protein [Domibacillus sp. DTU_2020_1001157_1_SI_ALB_TIR_016]WNS78350.1 ABC transporter ATP-binding protein [Domibacillus sp. DTU_2020_1001157_1_SI_ALB_TIR_016]
MNHLLDIKELSVGFKVKNGFINAVNKVDLKINKGEILCLVGESGSGKTITSLSIMRLIDFNNGVINHGDIQLNGQSLAKLTPQKMNELRGKKMAMIFQEPMSALDPVYSIGYQIKEVIKRHSKTNRATAHDKAVTLLKRVGIPEAELRMKQYPYELSGGMLQRVMIAIALAGEPDLLIADEPTTALDVTTQSQILHLLQELKVEFNLSILLITHDLGIAAQLAGRVVVMYSTKVVEEAPTVQLFDKPAHPYTKGLLQSIVPANGEQKKRLYSIKGSIPSLSNAPEGCRFHPRCPYATDQCKLEEPPLKSYEGRKVACWHADVLMNEDFQQTDTEAGVTIIENKKHFPEIMESSNEDTVSPLVEIVHLKKYFPIQKGYFPPTKTHIKAVDDVSFSIHKGETFGLVGESGCGKSTLGRVLLQLEKASSGNVLFQGKNLAALNRRDLKLAKADMQVVFQDPYGSINPRWKIGDIIGEPFRVHQSLSSKEQKEKVLNIMNLVGLNTSWYDRYPNEFSGGQRQRIGIARAIALNPKFILADEAVSALDVSVQSQIINLFQDLQDNLGLTYLFIGHGLDVMRHISNRIGVMYLGKLVEIAPADELFQHPSHHYTKALLSAVPIADPKQKRNFVSINGEIPSPANPPSGCRFHTRCPAAKAICRQETPDLISRGAGHQVACHFPL